MRHTLTLLSAMTMATAGFAQQQPQTPKAQGEVEKKLCRREMPTGSNLPKRMCRTKAEWHTIDEQNAENARNMRDNRSDRNAPPQ